MVGALSPGQPEAIADDTNGAAASRPTAAALAEAAQAEAAEAEAAAAAARERAIRLRRQADSTAPNTADAAQTVAKVETAHEWASETAPSGRRRRWRPRRRAVAVATTLAVVCALLTTAGYMAWHHRGVQGEHARAAQFAAAARQGVSNMMSLDFTKAKEDVERVLDSTTGGFKDDFARSAADFTSVVEQSKVVTKGTVNAAAVESMTGDSAVVLVAATYTVTNAAGAQEEPRSWRLSVTVSRDGGQFKMSKVEFVP